MVRSSTTVATTARKRHITTAETQLTALPQVPGRGTDGRIGAVAHAVQWALRFLRRREQRQLQPASRCSCLFHASAYLPACLSVFFLSFSRVKQQVHK